MRENERRRIRLVVEIFFRVPVGRMPLSGARWLLSVRLVHENKHNGMTRLAGIR